jgi:hypothetical protein
MARALPCVQGCRQERKVQASDGVPSHDPIPYEDFLCIWIACLCACMNNIISMRRRILRMQIDEPPQWILFLFLFLFFPLISSECRIN